MKESYNIKTNLKEPFADRLARGVAAAVRYLLRFISFMFILALILGTAHVITVTTGVPIFDVKWVLDGKITGLEAMMLFVFGWFLFVVLLDWFKFSR